MNIDIVLRIIPFLIGVIINGSNREHLGRFEHLLRQRQSKLRQDFLCRRIQKPATALLFSIFDGNMWLFFTRPICIFFIVVTALSVIMSVRNYRKLKTES